MSHDSYNVEPEVYKGCLVRWVIDYKYYAASDERAGVVPQEPIYNYGIVVTSIYCRSYVGGRYVLSGWDMDSVKHDTR